MKNYLIALLILLVNSSFAQCISGQRSVSLVVTTDDYGYEGYWELTSSANTCGNLTIANGGNLTVGCTAGTQNQDPSGYANNTVYNEGPWCLTDGAFYTIHYRDDWGDGGFQFRILIFLLALRKIVKQKNGAPGRSTGPGSKCYHFCSDSRSGPSC